MALKLFAPKATGAGPIGGRRAFALGASLAPLAQGVLSVEISVSSPGNWKGTLVHNQLMCDRFKDQVNVVQIKQPGGTRTLLFTPGGEAQPIG